MNKQTMPKEMKAKWLEALRSGKYPQGRGRLKDATGGYCCLGVLQMVVDGRIEMNDGFMGGSYPSEQWCIARYLPLYGPMATPTFDPILMIRGALATASCHNDARVPFTEIADAIEAQIEGV